MLQKSLDNASSLLTKLGNLALSQKVKICVETDK